MSVDGTWKINLTTPMGTRENTLKLTAAGGALSGTMSGPQGEIAIEDGAVDGTSVTWAIMAAQLGAKIQFKGTLDGDSLNGEAVLGAFGNAPFTGTRA